VTAALAQRQLGLGAVALLGAMLALAVGHRVRREPPATTIQAPVAPPVSQWTPALATVRPEPRTRSACGWLLRKDTFGVGHPVLPCGARILLAFRGRRILTQVVDRVTGSGAAFELTPALAKALGFRGTQPIRWTFASAPAAR